MAPRTRRRWRDVNKAELTLQAAISLFLMNQENRNHSRKKVRCYGDLLGRFAEWVGENERIADLNAETIKDYARSVRDRDLSKFTLDTEG